MINHQDRKRNEIRGLIRKGEIKWAGNIPNKIYGLLSCQSGKRMKRENRIFFKTESEAIHTGFRPCGHCLRVHYTAWKNKK